MSLFKAIVEFPEINFFFLSKVALCLQDNLWGYRLSLHRGKSGAAGTKRGQLLEVKDERYKQPVIQNKNLRGGYHFLPQELLA